MPYDIEFITRREDLAPLRDEWHLLQSHEALPNVFSTHEFVLARADGGPLTVALARSEGRLVAALPLRRRPGALPILSPIADSPRNDPPLLPGHEAAIAELFAATLARAGDGAVISIDNVTTGSAVARLDASSHLEGRVWLAPQSGEHYTTVEGDFDAWFEHHFARRTRTKLRRYVAQLEQAGARLDVLTNPDDLGALVRRMAPHKWRSLAGRANTSLACSRQGRALLDTVAKRGLLVGYRLSIGDAFVAACVNWRHRGVEWYSIPTYNVDFARWSPGSALLHLMLRRAHATGVTELNFGHGEQWYKGVWSTHERPMVRVAVAGTGPRAALASALLRKSRELQAIAQATPRLVAVVQRGRAAAQWVRTRADRADAAPSGQVGALWPLALRELALAAERLRRRVVETPSEPRDLLLLARATTPPLPVGAPGDPEVDEISTAEYARVAAIRPETPPSEILENFRRRDVCFVGRMRTEDACACWVTPKLPSEHAAAPCVAPGYALVHGFLYAASIRDRAAERAVLRRTVADAARRGNRGVVLATSSRNERLLAAARELGFERVGRVPSTSGPEGPGQATPCDRRHAPARGTGR